MEIQIKRHPSVKERTAVVLLHAVDAIEKESERLDMQRWCSHPDMTATERSPDGVRKWGHDCSTVMCLAGWIVFLASDEEYEQRKDVSIARTAAWLAELTYWEGGELFNLEKWPYPFWRDFTTAFGSKLKAHILKERVKHYIETGQ